MYIYRRKSAELLPLYLRDVGAAVAAGMIVPFAVFLR